MMKTIATAAVGAVFLVSGHPAEAKTLRFAAPLGAKLSFGIGAQWWMDEITKRTNGELEFRAFFGGSLVGGAEVLPALKSGRVDVAMIAAVYNPGDFPLWIISTLPFMSDNAIAQTQAVAHLYEVDETFRSEFEKHNVVVSMFQPVAPAATLTVEPMTSRSTSRARS